MQLSWESAGALGLALVMLAGAIYRRVHGKASILPKISASASSKANYHF